MVLALDMMVGKLVPQLVEVVMGKCFHGPRPPVGVVDHHGIDETEELQIRRGKDLARLINTVRHYFFLIIGKRQSRTQQSGFISSTSSWVGAPITLMISRRWLMLVSPMNSGSPFSSSRMTQPADQMSTTVEYLVAPKMSSGARQHLAQMQEMLASLEFKSLAEPKSQMAAALPLRSMFSGLMSLWQTPRECRQLRPLKIWQRMILASRLLTRVSLQKLMRLKRFSSQWRIMMLRYSMPDSWVMKLPSISTTKSLRRILMISIYRFLQRESCTTFFIAMISPVLRILPRNTLPNVPSPMRSVSQISSLMRQEGVDSRLNSVFIFWSFFFDFLWLLHSRLFSWLFLLLRSNRSMVTDSTWCGLEEDFWKLSSDLPFSFFSGFFSFFCVLVKGSNSVTSFLAKALLFLGESTLLFSPFLRYVLELFLAICLGFFSSFLGLA